MGILEAIILGIIQGLTEFLPVSSSGHLELAKAMFGDSVDSEQGLLFTIIVHAATALSTLVIFRKDVAEIFKGLLSFKWNEETQFSLKIILSMIPATLVGFFFKNEIDALFGSSIVLVGCMLLVTGLLLLLADKAKQTNKNVSFSKSIIIGISQAIAILPGISRSGATISTSVLLGIDRTKAARFSFLMVVPLILGAVLMMSKDYMELKSLNEMEHHSRIDLIMTELGTEVDLSDEEKEDLEEIINGKEITWDKIRTSGYTAQLNRKSRKQLKETYVGSMEEMGLSEEKISQILDHDYGAVRSVNDTDTLSLILGFLAAFFTGLFACKWMIQLVKKAKLTYFSFYCFIIGLVAIGFGFWT